MITLRILNELKIQLHGTYISEENLRSFSQFEDAVHKFADSFNCNVDFEKLQINQRVIALCKKRKKWIRGVILSINRFV